MSAFAVLSWRYGIAGTKVYYSPGHVEGSKQRGDGKVIKSITTWQGKENYRLLWLTSKQPGGDDICGDDRYE